MATDPHADEPQALPDRATPDPLDAARVMANVAAGLFGTTETRPKVGRFVLLDQLGAGAMGTVYSAFDPELDRKIAIKVLHHRVGDEQARARTRLLREGRALAKLAHPNVATLYEVGTVQDRVFLAMEFVAGQPLETWMETAHDWREVTRVFAAAGEGLAAAHTAGIIHRDFKPGNVVLGDDGRVTVLDFGLATPDGPTETDEPQTAPDANDEAAEPLGRLTATHGVVGTPAYMAPEQHRGEPATAASDQFAYCVSLFEALYGARPFEGTTRQQVLLAIEDNAVTLDSDISVPRWLQRAVIRGLAPDPDDRWPSLPALLDAITHDPAARVRRWAAPALFAAVVLGGGWLAADSGNEDPCRDVASEIQAIWNPAARARLQEGLGETATTQAVLTQLDTYVAALTPMRVAACEAEQADTPLPGATRHAQCLDERIRAMEATVHLLQSPSEQMLRNAQGLIPVTEDLQACPEMATEGVPSLGSAPQTRREVESAIARARVLLDVGDVTEGLAQAVEALALARTTDDVSLVARATVKLGQAQLVNGESVASEATFQEALLLAVRANDHEAKVNALRMLSRALVQSSKLEQAERMADLAVASTEHFDRLPLEWDLTLLEVRGDLARARDQPKQALEYYARMVTMSAQPGAPVFSLLSAKTALASALLETGQRQEAGALYREVEVLARRQYGDVHRVVAVVLDNQCIVAYQLGDLPQAESFARRSLQIRRQLVGPDHPSLAASLTNLGGMLSTHDPQAALEPLNQALRLRLQHSGDKSFAVAQVLSSVGNTHRKLGDLNKARAAYLRAAGIVEAAKITGSKRVRIWVRLAEVEIELDDCTSALARLGEVDAIADRGNEASRRSIVRMDLAVARCTPDHDAALARATKALAFVDEHELRGTVAAMANITVAEYVQAKDAPRALSLARKAQAFAAEDPSLPKGVGDRINAFVAAAAPQSP